MNVQGTPAATVAPAASVAAERRGWRPGPWLVHLVLWSPLLISVIHVIGFTGYTTWISFTSSTLVPENDWVGLRNYNSVMASRNWTIATDNLFIFGFGFVALTTAIGLLLAILIDQRIRAENLLRTIFLYRATTPPASSRSSRHRPAASRDSGGPPCGRCSSRPGTRTGSRSAPWSAPGRAPAPRR